MDSILVLHPSSVFVEKPLDAQHLVPVEPSLLRPPRRCECLACLVPDLGDSHPLFRVHKAPGLDCRADSLQRNGLDRCGHLHRQRVPRGDAEERRVRGCVPDPLGSYSVLAGSGCPQLEQARAALRNRLLDAETAPVHQGHHRPRDSRVVRIVDEPAANHLALHGRSRCGLQHDQGHQQSNFAAVGSHGTYLRCVSCYSTLRRVPCSTSPSHLSGSTANLRTTVRTSPAAPLTIL